MTFAQEFAAANANSIRYEGRDIYKSLFFDVSENVAFSLRFLRGAEKPVQGFALIGEHCKISIAGTVAKNIALWRDTAPPEVTFSVVSAKRGATLTLFNQWRDEKYGSTMYHLNNAAMQVERLKNGRLLLQCSDGWGEPNFQDLIAELAKIDP